jgi:hypothetical protein
MNLLLLDAQSPQGAYIAALQAICVALIGATSAVIVALAGKKKELKQVESEKKSLLDELDRQSDALGGFGALRLEFSRIEAEFVELCEVSEIDRIIVLCAWNGATDAKYSTAVWQFRQGYSTSTNYLRVALDGDYSSRLASCKYAPQHFLTKDLPAGCLIREIYESEGITESVWIFLDRQFKPDGTALNTFMSFSAKRGPITPKTLTLCKLLADQVKALCRL